MATAVNIFNTIITQGVAANQMPARTKASREWFRETAGKIGRLRNEKSTFKKDTQRLTNNPMIGSMYLFNYDPKHKETLPYYDRLPLIFPFKYVQGGFYGLNLHYLPLQYRAKLMDGLYDYANNTRYDETTRIKLNYQLLKSVSGLKFFKPCVKHYLTEHVKSSFFYVKPDEWDVALFLPYERFSKATKTQVWADTKAMYGG